MLLSLALIVSIWFISHRLMLLLLWKTTLKVDLEQLTHFSLKIVFFYVLAYPEIIFISSLCSKMPGNSLWITDGSIYSALFSAQKGRCLLSGVALEVSFRRESPFGAFLHHCRSPFPGLSAFVCMVVSKVGMGNVVSWNLWRQLTLEGLANRPLPR